MTECECNQAFGQLIHREECRRHARCAAIMRGIGIRCILVEGHKGDHK